MNIFRCFLLVLFFNPVILFAESSLSYVVHWHGVDKAEVLSTLEKSSHLISMQKAPPLTLTSLRQRVEKDLPVLVQSLHYYAYYDARIEPRIEQSATDTAIHLDIYLGVEYKIKAFELSVNENNLELSIPKNVRAGQLAITQNILNAESSFIQKLHNNGYPLAKKIDRQAIVDQAEKTLEIHLELETGPFLKSEEPIIVGLEKVKEAYVRKNLKWKIGEAFSVGSLDDTRKILEETGLFSYVQLIPALEPRGDVLPVTISLSERKHRSVAVGGGFNSYNGLGILLEWEHRNIRKQGEILKFDGDIAEKKKTLAFTFLKPHFILPSQTLLWTLQGEKLSTQSYIKESFELGVTVKRDIAEYLDLSLGTKMEQQRTTRSSKNGINTLLSVPFHLNAYFVDDKVNPKEGFLTRYHLAPYTILGSDVAFLRQSLTGAYFLPLNQRRSLILNSWVTIGSITGQHRDAIPIPERFLAGSDHALRGYAYKMVSPLDSERKALGGRSMLLTGLEMVYSFSTTLSGALFFEAGDVFEETFPKIGTVLLRSWGLGMRYHTPVGPLRLDVAFPMDRRRDVDQSFQVYLSIGQGF